MAETAVNFVVDKLVSLLTSEVGQISNEVNQLRAVHREIQDIKDELENMGSFLRDAEERIEKGRADSVQKTSVKQARELAFLLEDVIDEYMLHVRLDQNDQLRPWGKVSRFVKKLKERREVASKIREMKRLVREMKERNDRYYLGPSSEQGGSGVGGSRDTSFHDPRVASHFVQEAELVGFETPKNDLLQMLLEDKKSKTVAISVVGMGGLGKTTLAKKVYDDQRVVDRFDRQAWTTVSQSYKVEELLRSIIKQFTSSNWEQAFEGFETMEEVMLIRKLRDHLSGKSCMVVFDDVWETEFWDYIKMGFPENSNGSRILITTRNENVAPSPNESPFYRIYKLQTLPPHEAFKLFCKRAFQSEGERCPTELQDLSQAVVERCEGLPLAIVTIGGLMATKEKLASEWQRLIDGLSAALASDDQHLATDRRLSGLARILSLSYHHLPYHLKSCFLYLGMFPEDYPIRRSRIIRLWIAQGFIRERQGMTPEEVAEEYLNELVCRSLVQVATVNPDGKPKDCRVHDVMRDVILSRCNELNLHQVSVRNHRALLGKGRHLCVYGGDMNFLGSSIGNFQTRSIILFGIHELPKPMRSAFFENAKLLTSLDFEGAPIDHIPEELGNLWHLRYLSLKYTKVKKLPRSIGKLSNLETLDLRDAKVRYLPNEINRLLKLSHLMVYSYSSNQAPGPVHLLGMVVRSSIGCLVALQKVGYIEADHGTDLFKDLEKLTQLRHLMIINLKREDGVVLCHTFEKMTLLRRLSISSRYEESLELESLSCPPPLLERLSLCGSLTNLPDWITKLKNLTRLNLNWAKLGDGVMEALKHLRNLSDLSIYESYEGKKLHFGKGNFPKLTVLHLGGLHQVNELVIEDGALPLLEILRIGPIPLLKELPFQFLRSLRLLELFDLRKELVLRAQPDGGQDYWRIKHVQTIFFFYGNRHHHRTKYKLGDPELLRRFQI